MTVDVARRRTRKTTRRSATSEPRSAADRRVRAALDRRDRADRLLLSRTASARSRSAPSTARAAARTSSCGVQLGKASLFVDPGARRRARDRRRVRRAWRMLGQRHARRRDRRRGRRRSPPPSVRPAPVATAGAARLEPAARDGRRPSTGDPAAGRSARSSRPRRSTPSWPRRAGPAVGPRREELRHLPGVPGAPLGLGNAVDGPAAGRPHRRLGGRRGARPTSLATFYTAVQRRGGRGPRRLDPRTRPRTRPPRRRCSSLLGGLGARRRPAPRLAADAGVTIPAPELPDLSSRRQRRGP